MNTKQSVDNKLDSIIKQEFPFKTFNPGQLEVIRSAVKALVSGTRHVIISAPTGSGKSAIGVTIHNVMKRLNRNYRSCIITTTIGLQQQYRTDYPNIIDLKSKIHYPCIHSPDTEYNSPSCIYIQSIKEQTVNGYKPKCDKAADCPYFRNRVTWTNCSDIKTTNSTFFTTAGHKIIAPPDTKLDLCVIDECHEIESVLVDRCAIKLRVPISTDHKTIEQLRILKRLPYPNSMVDTNGNDTLFSKDYFKLLDIVNKLPRDKSFSLNVLTETDVETINKIDYNTRCTFETIQESIARMEAEIKSESVSKVNDKLLSRLKSIEKELGSFLTSISFMGYHELYDDKYRWVIRLEDTLDAGENKSKARSKLLSIVPLSLSVGSAFTSKPLFSKAKQFIHMSATICGVETYAKNLGITDYKYIEVGNPIPIENRPVLVNQRNSLYINRNSNPGTISAMIDSIIDTQSRDSNGVIHTVSFKLAKDIVIHSKHSSRMIVSNNREEILSKLSENKGTIIVSPSIETGYDFKGDLARWQIISKVPFLNLGDLYVSQRRHRSSEWYVRETLLRTIQASGRICRGMTDYGTTYIIDKNFLRLVADNTHMVPEWYLNSIIVT